MSSCEAGQRSRIAMTTTTGNRAATDALTVIAAVTSPTSAIM